MWTFIIALLLGFLLGVFVMAILYAGREADLKWEREIAESVMKKGGNGG